MDGCTAGQRVWNRTVVVQTIKKLLGIEARGTQGADTGLTQTPLKVAGVPRLALHDWTKHQI